MKLIKLLVLLSFSLSLIACNDGQYLTFESKEGAEEEIGEFQTPLMPSGYVIKKITYEHDGFTHPVTKVFYEMEGHKITFMITSSMFDKSTSEKIKNGKIADMVWISKDTEYVLKWRDSIQQSYKYLFTSNEEDKEWLISIAENY
ncbi:hypothetical protein JOC85_001080 [Bacillus mesophilus]|uniref:DUF4367 domain-containing protein n=1 Tax=Bacillus mesophilus TaxID=1808955 RepID=A0A6M0Q3P3_9BACI|nr:hypothetical protein [Bacillus mesophilus]MBM7660313.1 hypothetical protein [Bacillus mesophilus]NEY71026.1 hypothetical protein [Bacillus mesophilus]